MTLLRPSLILLLWGVNPFAYAEQTRFEKHETEQEIVLNYAWLDHFEQPHTLNVRLNKEDIINQFRKVKSYMPDIARRYVYIAMQKEAQRVDPREARVQLQRVGKDFKVIVSSRSNKLLAKWQKSMASKQEAAFDKYLSENYYSRFTSYLGQEAVKPDHARYARESQTSLLPVAQALYEQLDNKSNTREYINLVLSWVQSIPYDTLEDRLTSNGSGYSPPLEVLINNSGDCDSKATLTVALLRALIPDLNIVMVLLPKHALLAAVLPHRETEDVIKIGESDYILLEPTGPATLLAGKAGALSNQSIASGMYSIDPMP